MIDLATLRTISIFAELTDDELREISRSSLAKSFQKEKIIFLEKEAAQYFYVVLTGKVKITLQREDGKEVILSWLGEGDFFGEMALLDEEPRSATVVAADAVELLVMPRELFNRVLRQNPAFMLRIFTTLSMRVRRANHQIASLALLDVYGRVARVITDLAREEGKRLKDGRIQLKLPPHREIANMIGTSRETVTRVLAGLVKHGYLESAGKSFVINETFPSEGKIAE